MKVRGEVHWVQKEEELQVMQPFMRVGQDSQDFGVGL